VSIRCNGNVFTEPLLSNDKGIHTDTDTHWRGILKCAAEMDSGVMMYIPSFIKIGSDIRKLILGGYTDSMGIT
jgi:hypothetical protein